MKKRLAPPCPQWHFAPIFRWAKVLSFLVSCFLVLFLPAALLAQDNLIPVKGKIVAAGTPVAGATVTVKGAGIATTADSSGVFHLRAPSDAVLVITHVNYASQEMAIRGRTSITIEMEASDKSLGDVIVVGYGTQKK